MGEDKILAVDIGGSHISAVLFDLEEQKTGEVRRVRVLAGGTAGEFMDTLVALCRQILPMPAPLFGFAAAVPNPFDYERGISYMKHKFQQLYGVDLRQALSLSLPCDPEKIYFLNDAEAYLIGELHQGAAMGVERAVAITLGTGIGSAFAVGGRTVVKGRGVPPGGEIWNLPYRGGIVEDWAGTAAIQRLHFEATGRRAEVREIASVAAIEPAARKTFERFGSELGQLLRLTMAEFAPQRIVVGGGIATSAPLFFPAAVRELAGLGIELRVSTLLECAPLIGAAIGWQQSHESMTSVGKGTDSNCIELTSARV